MYRLNYLTSTDAPAASNASLILAASSAAKIKETLEAAGASVEVK